jgi:hypothetical protein
LAEVIASLLKERLHLPWKVLCRHFCIAKGTCLRILHVRSTWQSSIFIGFPMPWTRIRRPKESLHHREFFRYYKAFVQLVSRLSSLERNRSSFWTIPVIRYVCRHEMKCQTKSVKNWSRKLSNFTSLSVNRIHSFVDVPKGSTYNSTLFWDTVVPIGISWPGDSRRNLYQ